MEEPNENVWTENAAPESAGKTPADFSGERNRETGEYHYRRDAGPIYSDAHYEPAGDTTTPPRFYTPPVRPERTRRAARSRERKTLGLGAVVAMCLICALLGGMLGAGANAWLSEGRFEAMERVLAENSRNIAENAGAIAAVSERQGGGSALPVSNSTGAMSPAQIYQQACSQVVGITTTVNAPGYFGSVSTGTITGSGFLLTEDGYIITNYHVVETADQSDLPITVVLYDGTEYEAQIVGREDVNDLAVLKIEATGLKPVTVGDSDAIQVGDEVYAVGNPMGDLEFSMSTGHVSALDRVITTSEAEDIPMFQLDAAVNPGNSGGPVYNTRGEVIGVVTAKYSDTDVEGLGFAIPINDAIRIAEDLVANGYVTGKAFMGVWTDERYNAMMAQYYGMPLGAYVQGVEKGSAADRAGIKSGDIITAIDGQTIESSSQLRTALRQFGAGDRAEITLYRAGKSMTLTIVFDEKTPESGTALPDGDN